MAADLTGRAPGIYVHIPFCLQRCDYCDFTTFADRDEAIPAYVDALCTHIRREAAHLLTRSGPNSSRREGAPDRAVDSADAGPGMSTSGMPTFGSVFVGGGTPTYLPPADLARILTTIADSFAFTADAEWTTEANPETIDEEMAAALVGAGINRVSLGAQSFDDRVLQTLGRWHDPDSVERAVGLLDAAGVGRLSLDLIYGTPGETDASWQRSLDRTLATGVRHLSAYALTVEPNTPYAARARQRPALVPDDDVQAARMAVAEQTMTSHGLARYEVSNWAEPGLESRHNLTYWRGGEWLAFGSGAHGSWDGRRYWMVRDPARYARMVEEGEEPVGGEEHPDPAAVRLERLMMGLRLVEGVPRAQLEPLDPAEVDRLVTRGLITVDDTTVALTPDGLPLANQVILALA